MGAPILGLNKGQGRSRRSDGRPAGRRPADHGRHESVEHAETGSETSNREDPGRPGKRVDDPTELDANAVWNSDEPGACHCPPPSSLCRQARRLSLHTPQCPERMFGDMGSWRGMWKAVRKYTPPPPPPPLPRDISPSFFLFFPLGLAPPPPLPPLGFPGTFSRLFLFGAP